MKYIAVTQRVENIESYKEVRDSLDQRWIKFLLSVDLFPILIPNNITYLEYLISHSEIDGVLFTGGSSLVKYGGNSKERDEVEFFLMEWAIKKNIPILGVCRGMQVIQDYFKNQLVEVPNHVAERHTLITEHIGRVSSLCKKYTDVNSYHNYGSYEAHSELIKVATSADGVVMAIEHQHKNIYGVMWHMEREAEFCEVDKLLFNKIFDSSI